LRVVLAGLRRPSPAAAAAILALASAGVRYAVAVNVATPLLYPDEYIHSALARSIVNGTFPDIRGGSVPFFSYLAPLLMAPAWLISNVEIGYRVAQAFGCIAFATAAAPAYLLARRIGVTGYRATAVAALALVVPDGLYTSGLLAEPYTYPVFLLGVLVAVEAIGAPTTRNQLALVGIALVLPLLAGAQMVVFGAAYLPAAYIVGPHSPRAFLKAQRMIFIAIATGVVLLAAAVAESPSGRLAHVYQTGTQSFHYPLEKSLGWYAADLFVITLAAGWVIVPGAALGLWSLLRSGDLRRKGFGVLTLVLLAGLILEATPFGVNVNVVEERYAFYGVPLIVAAFAVAWEEGLLHGRALWLITALAAAVAVLLPVDGPLLASGTDEAPTLHGLGQLAPAGAVEWAPLLAAAVLVGALWRRGTWIAVVAICIGLVVSAGASWNLIQTSRRAPDVRADAPSGSSVLTWAGGDPYVLMRTLFWNPRIGRVLVLGPGIAPDSYPAQSVRLAPGPRVETPAGQQLSGPYVFTRDGVVLGGGRRIERGTTMFVERAPSVVALGWDRRDGWVAPGASIFAAGGRRPATLIVGLRATDGDTKVLRFHCDYGLDRVVRVGVRAVKLAVPVARGRAQACDMRILEGKLTFLEGKPASIKGTLALREG
jgi:hypothetical protein